MYQNQTQPTEKERERRPAAVKTLVTHSVYCGLLLLSAHDTGDELRMLIKKNYKWTHWSHCADFYFTFFTFC